MVRSRVCSFAVLFPDSAWAGDHVTSDHASNIKDVVKHLMDKSYLLRRFKNATIKFVRSPCEFDIGTN